MGELSGTHRASLTLWTGATGKRLGGWAKLKDFRDKDRAAIRIIENRGVGRAESGKEA